MRHASVTHIGAEVFMYNLRFALCSIIILMLALASCSVGGNDFKEPPGIDEETEDDFKKDLPVKDKPSDNDSSNPSLPKDDDEEGETEEEEDEEIPDELPLLLINEIRTEYSGTAKRAEYIELKALESGNLAGLRVFVASNTKDTLVYTFLPIGVRKGEYVVLHLRTLDDSCIDEYEGGKDESGGRDSSPVARDFYVPGNSKLLRKTDAVYIKDMDDNVLDAVMIAVKPFPKGSLDFFTKAAEFLFNEGAWKSANGGMPGIEDAVDSTGIGSALTRSISRNENAKDSNTAADWYITANGGITPGRKNN
jgi:hypothetical protein